jgi:EAL and modified HD-GYP domain-containing signal transduction protein
MHDVNFIVREPLLDPKQKILGYELSWQAPDGTGVNSDPESASALIAFAGDRLNDSETGWLLSDNVLFFQANDVLLSDEILAAVPAKHTVLTVTPMHLGYSATVDRAKALLAEGFGIALRDADVAGKDAALLSAVSHVELRFGADDFSKQAKMYATLKQSSKKMIGRNISNWQEYDSCASLGVDAFIGNLYLTPRPGTHPKGLNPAQAIILQLMDMVRKNTDVRKLEEVLKRDAALSYKLLRYINSAGFGLGTEIQSLKHAVTMLGYQPLYRWLSVLLTVASSGAQSPVLMQTAIVRGRFAELLSKGFLPKAEAENLFVAGMFSLLDRLLGIPMEEVLENIQLPEPVTQALLTREGMYGPFLSLAEACECGNGAIGELADSLFISATQVNEAHMASLAWAQMLKL